MAENPLARRTEEPASPANDVVRAPASVRAFVPMRRAKKGGGWVWGGRRKNVQIETQSHSSVLPAAHTTATSERTICSSQSDEEKSEAEMKTTNAAA